MLISACGKGKEFDICFAVKLEQLLLLCRQPMLGRMSGHTDCSRLISNSRMITCSVLYSERTRDLRRIWTGSMLVI